MQIFRRQVSVAITVLLMAGAMTSIRGDQRRSGASRSRGINSLVRVEILASGFKSISGIAVETSGAVLVTDRTIGTLTRLAASGKRHEILAHFHKPRGVAVDGTGGVLVLDEDGERLVRLGADGSRSVVTSALRRARAVTVGPDGRIWVATRQVNRRSDRDRRSGTARDAGYAIARVEASGAVAILASGFVDVRAIAADVSHVYVAMGDPEKARDRQVAALARVSVGATGEAEAVEPLFRHRYLRAYGVAIDAVGDVFIGGVVSDKNARSDWAVVKRRRTGQVSVLAAGQGGPVVVAFGPNGDLMAGDVLHGRVIRFKATPAPRVVAPPFTNQAFLEIGGRSIPGALVQAFHPSDYQGSLATTTAGATNGRFTLPVSLVPNAETPLSLVSTAAGGAGLASTPHTLLVVHDDRRPTVTITEPPVDTHVRDGAAVRARGEDGGSGLAALAFMLDDEVVERVDNPQPGQSLAAAAQLDTSQVLEGPHTVTVVATDRAQNTAAAAQLLVVDRTPPDTRIVTGPPAETPERTARFTVSGADAQSVDLDFAWRLDTGAWSVFSPSTTVVVTAPTTGVHTFEVKARDLAGNEDPLPAAQTYTVTPLRIRITEPADGVIITTPSVWLRGTVEGGDEVTVTVPLPPGMVAPSVPASTEAGTFAVEVPVAATTITLTAIAVDATMATATDTISVAVQPGPAAPRTGFKALPAAGLAPHAVAFSVNLGEGTRIELDLNGDGTVDFDGPALEGLPFVYNEPGIYLPTLSVITTDGQILTYRTVVEVYDRAALDTRLQAVWTDFKAALQSGDVARAVGFIHGNRRAAWQDYFEQLTPDELAVEGGGLTTIELVRVGRGGAEYEMLREEDGRVFSYPVALVVDADGRWRLWQF